MLTKNSRGRWVWPDGRRLRAGQRVKLNAGVWLEGVVRYYHKRGRWGIVLADACAYRQQNGKPLVLGLHTFPVHEVKNANRKAANG